MILIKIGGGKTINLDFIAEDIAEISKKEAVILVHGASEKRDEIAKKLGIPSKVITSPSGIQSVYTDQKALDVFLMVYAGLVNKTIVGKLQKLGVNAVGLCGVDGRLWEGKRKDAVYSLENGKTKLIKDNLTGKVEKINAKLIELLIKNGYTPVVCPPAISFEGEIINTDNDLAMAIMAGALKIKKIVVLFEEAGFLKNYKNEKSLIRKVSKETLDEIMKYAQGRMKKKIMGTKKALELGAQEIYFGDGRIKNPILNALKGNGTIIN